MSRPAPASKIESGVDYVRATSKNDQGARNLEEVFRVRETEAMLAGFLPQFGTRYGYEGFHIGPYYFGRRGDCAMLEVSSESAHHVIMSIDWENCNATRIDLQVTAWSDHGESWASLQKERVASAIEANTGNKMAEPLLISPRKGKGDTLSLGSRSSPRYGRLYNKGLQSGEDRYLGAWRYEVEYKGESVPHILRGLRASKCDLQFIVRTVAGQFDKWFVERTFHTESPIAPASLGKRRTDLERKLEWLAGQVRGTVEILRQNGLEYKALEALGFVEPDRAGD